MREETPDEHACQTAFMGAEDCLESSQHTDVREQIMDEKLPGILLDPNLLQSLKDSP